MQHGIHVYLGHARTGDKGGDLLFFVDLPVDELLDIWMIDIDDDHLGCAAGGAPGLDGASGTIPDFQETHQPGRFAAA